METSGNISVKAIKGKFEQLQNAAQRPILPDASKPLFLSRKQKLSAVITSPPSPVNRYSIHYFPDEDKANSDGIHYDSYCIISSDTEQSMKNRDDETRYRSKSHSVGSIDKLSVSYKDDPQVATDSDGKLSWPDHNSYNNFSSFSEKQKLVESIVMNIKNSRCNANKENGLIITNNKNQKTKESQTVTSKLEKDIKNVLERGVRRLSRKNYQKKLPINERTVCVNEKQTNAQSYGAVVVSLPPDKQQYFPKFNNTSKLGLDASSEVECNRENVQGVNKGEGNENNFGRNLESCRKTKLDSSFQSAKNPKHINLVSALHDEEPSHYESYENTSPEGIHSNSNEMMSCGNGSVVRQGRSEYFGGPVRPPRKRSPHKKGRAPLPPGQDCANEYENLQIVNDKYLAEQEGDRYVILPEGGFSFDYNSHRYSDSQDNPAFDLTASRTHESNDDSVVKIPLQMGSPPKKPPRTFAHDIYKNISQSKHDDFNRPRLLSPEELESLYSKPIKKNKVSAQIGPHPQVKNTRDMNSNNQRQQQLKPAIAPKPTDIVSVAKKRYSLAEPLTAPTKREYADHRPSVKRNSSLKLSFRKSKKGSNSLHNIRQASKKDGYVAGRLWHVTKNWRQKKEGSSRHVKFRPKTRYDEATENQHDGTELGRQMYSTPTKEEPSTSKEQQQQPELHYMCSPLFPDVSAAEINTTEVDGTPHQNRVTVSFQELNETKVVRPKGLMDGLRGELRQSYRFVQKRLKGHAVPDKKNSFQ